uniref:Toll-like receptor n=1 Tax=Eisenia andrei TaxID=168636 RepID=A0AA49X7Z5_9ANNE|nr:Toll-like receptor [Eisenia andrei]
MIVELFIIAAFVLPEAVADRYDRVLAPERSGEAPSCFKGCRVSELSVDCRKAMCKRIPMELGRKTVKLIMTGSRLSYLSSESFDHVPSLQYLDLGNCHIEKLKVDTFDRLVQLRFLNLSFNSHIHISDQTMFHKLTRLRELYLTRTAKMSTFDSTVLLNLTGLTKFWFGINQLTTFPNFLDARNKSLVPNIVELNLENNNIERIKRAYMRGLESVERINLNGNRIYTVWSNSFAHLVKLTHLEMDRNYELCPRLYAFKSLSLKHLSLADVGQRIFREGQCRKEIFNRIPNLIILNIARSRALLNSLCLFFNLKRLEVLNLRGTGVTSEMLPYIARRRHLRILDVSENEINVLQRPILQNLKLEVLLLRDNWLSVINITTLPEDTWDRLTRVDFSENTLYCDCQVVWFRRWLKKRKNTTVENLHLTRCTGPAEVKDVPIHLLKHPTDLECFSEEADAYLLSVFFAVFMTTLVTFLVAILHRLRWILKYWYFRYKARAKEFRELLDQQHYEFDAFLSYSETNYEWVVDQLHPRLENEFGLRLCIHHRDWSLGSDIVDNIVNSIERSRKTVLIVSNAFAVSQWCHFEMTMAQTKLFEDDRDNLILVLLEEIADCNMNPRLQLQMQKQTYIEWTENEIGQQLFWERLGQALVTPSTSLINEIPPRQLFH